MEPTPVSPHRPLTGVLACLAILLVGFLAVPASAGTVTDPPQPSPSTSQPPYKAYEGSGTRVIAVELPDPTEVAVARISHAGDSNFAVWELDEDLNQIGLLVNTIGDYAGTVPLNLSADATTTSFEITADGTWQIEVRHILDIRTFDNDINGTGDDVLAYLGDTQVMFVSHEGDANFAIWSYGDENELIVNEIGAYDATVPLPGPTILAITANGPWSISPG